MVACAFLLRFLVSSHLRCSVELATALSGGAVAAAASTSWHARPFRTREARWAQVMDLRSRLRSRSSQFIDLGVVLLDDSRAVPHQPSDVGCTWLISIESLRDTMWSTCSSGGLPPVQQAGASADRSVAHASSSSTSAPEAGTRSTTCWSTLAQRSGSRRHIRSIAGTSARSA